ncbi:MAG TPA: TIR domain-containing protein [Acidobacteriaceae bacterium]|jgi:hypothetical protein
MAYRNKTYIIFDGDNDMWAYGYMKGWKTSEHVDFDFNDAHDLKPLTDQASEETVKRSLRTRFSNAKQVIVIVGEKTKNLYRFVRWEIDVAISLGLPVVVVNLNGTRKLDTERCPPILKGHPAVHVSFKKDIIKYALDDFVDSFVNLEASGQTDFYYKDSIYTSLGL